mgnify:CR=1 FL=1
MNTHSIQRKQFSCKKYTVYGENDKKYKKIAESTGRHGNPMLAFRYGKWLSPSKVNMTRGQQDSNLRPPTP